MSSIFNHQYPLDQVYVKAAQYSAENIEINEITQEVNRLEGEYNQALVQNDDKVRSIDAIQDEVQKHGMSRPIVERIASIVERRTEDYTAEHGISVEQFTPYPSRISMEVAIDLTDGEKAGLIGAAIATALLIIGKIIHVIWKFFRGKKDTDKTRNEAAKKAQENAKFLKEMEEQAKADPELMKELANLDKELAEDEYRNGKSLTASFTKLLKEVFYRGPEAQALEKVFLNIPSYERAADDALGVVEDINNNIKTWVDNKELDDKIESIVKPLYSKLPPKDMVNNLEELQALSDKWLAYDKETVTMDSNELNKIIDNMANNHHILFWEKIQNYSPYRNSGLNNQGYEEKITKAGNQLAEAIKSKDISSSLTKDQVTELKKFVEYYRKETQLYLKVVVLYTRISSAYTNFLNKVDKEMNFRKNFVERWVDNKIKKGESTDNVKLYNLKKFFEEAKSGRQNTGKV